MANLFNKAKTTAPKTAAKKDEKVRVNLNDPDFFTKVYKLVILQDRMKSDKAQSDMLADEIKDLSTKSTDNISKVEDEIKVRTDKVNEVDKNVGRLEN